MGLLYQYCITGLVIGVSVYKHKGIKYIKLTFNLYRAGVGIEILANGYLYMIIT